MIPFSGGRQLGNGRRTGLGSGFGGVVAYLTRGPRAGELAAEAADRVAWTSTRNLPVEEPDHAALFMRAWANQNARVKRPVYHFGVSLAPDEHLDRAQWQHVADRMLERLGLERHQALIALHTDRDHEHIHIAVNRVGPDLRVWKPSHDVFKQQDAARELERELGLRVVPTLRDRRRELREASGLERREVEKPFAQRVARAALDDFRRAQSWEELEARLAARGLRLEPAKRGGGVNVTDGRERAGVARVDRSLSGPRLAERYGETLREYLAREPERPALERKFGRLDVTPALPPEVRAQNLIRHLAAERATWTESDLRRLSARDPDADELVRLALASDEVVAVGAGLGVEARYTSLDYQGAERAMFAAGDQLAGRGHAQLPRESLDRLLEARYARHLSGEQRAAVLHATTGRDLALIVGRAGAGKTRLTRAIAEAYRQAGYTVRGAALGGKAAEGLAAEAGIEARTLASYQLAWQEGRGELGSRDVLIVDEAGMVDVRQLRRVLEHAGAGGAKVVLLGDPDQLKAIGAGDAFRGLIEQHGAARVDTIRRQAQAWQREASECLADGHLERGLAAYAERGAIQWHTDPDQARDALVMAYFEDRYMAPDQSSLILAHRRVDVRRLNDRIREVRRDAGELGAGVRLSGRELSAGDRVLFLRNDSGRDVRTVEGEGQGVKNGTLGTLIEAQPERLRVRLDSGRLVEFDPRVYDRLDHGYAATIHKAQGATVDRAYVLAGRGFDRNLAYVALTRHRHRLRLYVDSKTFRSSEDLLRAFYREPRKDLIRDYRVHDAARLNEAARPTQAGDDFQLPPLEPPPAELTPERLKSVQGALERLERWDDLSSRATAVDRGRADLPYRGSLPDLDREIRALEQPPRRLPSDLRRIYRDPRTARRAFEQHALDRGLADSYRQLADSPETFGRLKGGRFAGRAGAQRARALETVRRSASDGLERHSRLLSLREARQAADRCRLESLELHSELATIGGSRSEVLDEVRRHAAGLDLDQLDGRLPSAHVEALRDLRRADEIHLRPIRAAVKDFQRQLRLFNAPVSAPAAPARTARAAGKLARRLRKPPVPLLRQARSLMALARPTPTKLLKQLAPPQLRLLLTATCMAAVAVKTLSEPEARRRTPRSFLRP